MMLSCRIVLEIILQDRTVGRGAGKGATSSTFGTAGTPGTVRCTDNCTRGNRPQCGKNVAVVCPKHCQIVL